MHVPGADHTRLAGRSGDRAGPGVVLPCLRTDVTTGGVPELGEHPGTENDPETGLAEQDLSVRVPAEMSGRALLEVRDLAVQRGRGGVHLSHVLHACSLAVRRMKNGGRGGSIVNLSTIEAHRAASGFAVYSATKAAVEQFARTLAVEVAPDRIRVNNVAPDFVPTPNLERLAAGEHALADPRSAAIAIPMGRVGHVHDISNCVVFLASGLSSFITGTTLHPDGGTLASSGWFNWPGHGWANYAPADVLERTLEGDS